MNQRKIVRNLIKGDTMEQHVGRAVRKLHNQITRKMEENDVVTRAQGRILYYVYIESKTRDVYQKDIEKEFNLRRASATEILQKLEIVQMIERISCESDKRLKKICVTEKGKEHILVVAQRIEKMEATLQEGFSDEEIQCFLSMCERMISNCMQVSSGFERRKKDD